MDNHPSLFDIYSTISDLNAFDQQSDNNASSFLAVDPMSTYLPPPTPIDPMAKNSPKLDISSLVLNKSKSQRKQSIKSENVQDYVVPLRGSKYFGSINCPFGQGLPSTSIPLPSIQKSLLNQPVISASISPVFFTPNADSMQYSPNMMPNFSPFIPNQLNLFNDSKSSRYYHQSHQPSTVPTHSSQPSLSSNFQNNPFPSNLNSNVLNDTHQLSTVPTHSSQPSRPSNFQNNPFPSNLNSNVLKDFSNSDKSVVPQSNYHQITFQNNPLPSNYQDNSLPYTQKNVISNIPMNNQHSEPGYQAQKRFYRKNKKSLKFLTNSNQSTHPTPTIVMSTESFLDDEEMDQELDDDFLNDPNLEKTSEGSNLEPDKDEPSNMLPSQLPIPNKSLFDEPDHDYINKNLEKTSEFSSEYNGHPNILPTQLSNKKTNFRPKNVEVSGNLITLPFSNINPNIRSPPPKGKTGIEEKKDDIADSVTKEIVNVISSETIIPPDEYRIKPDTVTFNNEVSVIMIEEEDTPVIIDYPKPPEGGWDNIDSSPTVLDSDDPYRNLEIDDFMDEIVAGSGFPYPKDNPELTENLTREIGEVDGFKVDLGMLAKASQQSKGGKLSVPDITNEILYDFNDYSQFDQITIDTLNLISNRLKMTDRAKSKIQNIIYSAEKYFKRR